jgi:NAD(P)H-hydrate epimerase
MEILQVAVPEAMVDKDDSFYSVTALNRNMSDFSAVAIGPGMGRGKSTQQFMRNFLSHSRCSLVIDADGLNFLSENLAVLEFLPHGTILTPHLGEFERLVGSWETVEERDVKQQTLSDRYGLVVILKGPNSRITIPGKASYRNTTGNPGMAKGGSGDVLTGIVLGFLAQGYQPEIAAVLATYIHGRAGDLAALKYSVQGMLPSDLINEIPTVFLEIQ